MTTTSKILLITAVSMGMYTFALLISEKATSNPSSQPNEYALSCQNIDNLFARCENKEVICYKYRGYSDMSCLRKLK